MNVAAARLARQAADDWTARTPHKPRFVAGAIGPTNRTLSISPEVNNPACRAITFDALCDAYKEQVRGLVDGGCDLLLVETVFDTLNCKAALVAIDEVFEERGRVSAAVTSETRPLRSETRPRPASAPGASEPRPLRSETRSRPPLMISVTVTDRS